MGPRKDNNSLKGPLLNHLTSEKTKHNFSSILMLQATCIYLGLITPCPETYHPLHPPRRLITPLPICQCHLNKRILKSLLIDVSLTASTNLPISMKPPQSLSALSLVVRSTVAPPCLNKGTLLLLRSSFLFCLARTMPYTQSKRGPGVGSLPVVLSPLTLRLCQILSLGRTPWTSTAVLANTSHQLSSISQTPSDSYINCWGGKDSTGLM